jgi:tyrosinase
MKPEHEKRREFLTRSLLAVGAATLPVGFATGATLYGRLEWQTFKTTVHYSALLQAMSRMQANGNSADPSSWAYWVNAHVRYCPHNVPYFIAWHRGFLYYFERQLRTVSGDSQLTLPYWDYYVNPNIPSEFTLATPGNPLWASRVNTNVRSALTLAPFGSTITNFPRGMTRAFEPSIESAPHNPVHDIIGGWMTTMESPVDPIFWLHHANIDRLWVAWVAAGAGRWMPSRTSTYWSGSFTYSGIMSLKRLITYDTRSIMGYYYQRETMPTSLPALTASPALQSEQLATEPALTAESALTAPPAVGSNALSVPRATGPATFSAAGALDVALENRSISVQLPVPAEYGKAMAQIAAGNAAVTPGSTLRFSAVELVLDEIALTRSGQQGGYFYRLYLNVPGAAGRVRSVLVDTLGPFRVAGAQHHHGGPARLRFDVSDKLAGLSPTQLGMLTLSFVRVSGDVSPEGAAMTIGEARLELVAASSAS